MSLDALVGTLTGTVATQTTNLNNLISTDTGNIIASNVKTGFLSTCSSISTAANGVQTTLANVNFNAFRDSFGSSSTIPQSFYCSTSRSTCLSRASHLSDYVPSCCLL